MLTGAAGHQRVMKRKGNSLRPETERSTGKGRAEGRREKLASAGGRLNCNLAWRRHVASVMRGEERRGEGRLRVFFWQFLNDYLFPWITNLFNIPTYNFLLLSGLLL